MRAYTSLGLADRQYQYLEDIPQDILEDVVNIIFSEVEIEN